MKIEAQLSFIYPDINGSIQLPHPVTGLTYQSLTNTQLVTLAHQTLQRVVRTNIKQVIVSESGAIPFAKMCSWITVKKNLGIQWYSIKIPRDIQNCFLPTFQAYSLLSADQLKLTHNFNEPINEFDFSVNNDNYQVAENYFDSHGMALRDIIESFNAKLTHIEDYTSINPSSGLANILKKPFIFFDEYVDSGKTLFQSLRFFQLFAKLPRFKIFCYLIKLHQKDIDSNICESLYTLDNEYEAYQWGTYPFENRIDWLGYYYLSNKNQFQKVAVAQFSSSNHDVSHYQTEILELINLLSQNIYLNQVKSACLIPDVANKWINHNHLVQYSLYKLEEIHFGKGKVSEFLQLLFDMYGPSWSPLPDSYHLSYLDAFSKVNEAMNSFFSNEFVKKTYLCIRDQLLQQIIYLFKKRRFQQQQNLLKTLENHYES